MTSKQFLTILGWAGIYLVVNVGAVILTVLLVRWWVGVL